MRDREDQVRDREDHVRDREDHVREREDHVRDREDHEREREGGSNERGCVCEPSWIHEREESIAGILHLVSLGSCEATADMFQRAPFCRSAAKYIERCTCMGCFSQK